VRGADDIADPGEEAADRLGVERPPFTEDDPEVGTTAAMDATRHAGHDAMVCPLVRARRSERGGQRARLSFNSARPNAQ
jgi:hypothetical protein